MIKLLRKCNFFKRFVSWFFSSYEIGKLLYQEICRLNMLIRIKRRYSNSPEVILGGLRTSAHILDKGIQAENWEINRGQTRYKKLCNDIETLKDSDLSMDPSFQWALQLKSEYEEAQRTGKCHRQTIERSVTNLSSKDLMELILSRRSGRSFKRQIIGPEILAEFANIINWAPSSCNRQPAKLFITQNNEKVSRCLQQCAGATCISDVTPCFMAVCADTRLYMIKDRDLPFVDTCLGLQNMLLVAHSHGIEGTILNWMHHKRKEETALREVLQIPEYFLIVVNLIMGYPDKTVQAPGRKNCNLSYTVIE